jgi:hypothetical protein
MPNLCSILNRATSYSAHPRESGDPGFLVHEPHEREANAFSASPPYTKKAWVPAFAGMSGLKWKGLGL